MDHGHGDHSGHATPMPSCSMNMLWNNQVANTCVVFRSWHISGTWTMILSCLVILGISVFYSYLLHLIKDVDRQIAVAIYTAGYNAMETGAANKTGVTRLPLSARVRRAGLYAISVAISFWLMLVAMTYNSYLFGSIIVGTFLGHIIYEGEMDVGAVLSGANGKGLACH